LREFFEVSDRCGARFYEGQHAQDANQEVRVVVVQAVPPNFGDNRIENLLKRVQRNRHAGKNRWLH